MNRHLGTGERVLDSGVSRHQRCQKTVCAARLHMQFLRVLAHQHPGIRELLSDPGTSCTGAARNCVAQLHSEPGAGKKLLDFRFHLPLGLRWRCRVQELVLPSVQLGREQLCLGPSGCPILDLYTQLSTGICHGPDPTCHLFSLRCYTNEPERHYIFYVD